MPQGYGTGMTKPRPAAPEGAPRSITVMDDPSRTVSTARAPASRAEPDRGRWGFAVGIPLGRLFGCPLRLGPTWVVLAILVTLAYGQILVEGRGLAPTMGYLIGFGF